jgi:UDP:flavonoid glycosyltransferase YjiC (YdhE family)
VYITLGTIFNRTQGVLDRLVAGAGQVDAEVVVTIGEDGTPPAHVPDNVVVERYLPQMDLYEHLAAVVCHGGFGTVFGAIGHGLPVACAPISADQVVNAALVDAAGAGCNLATMPGASGMFPVLQPGEPDPDVVASAIERLLHDDHLRAGAGVLAAEMAAAAPPAEAADLVERLVATGEPVPRP